MQRRNAGLADMCTQLKFDPYKPYGKLSYFQAVVKPLATAMKVANWRKKDVYFSMQAEMVGAAQMQLAGSMPSHECLLVSAPAGIIG